MKRKVLVVIAVVAIVITTFKTGYAYYESQLKTLPLQNSVDQDLGVDDSIETYDLTWDEDGDVNDYKVNEGEEFQGGCCGGGE